MAIAWSVVSKLFIGLFCLIIVVRVLGKKSLTQISPYDFVYTLVLGGILEETIYDDNVSIFHLLLGFALWGGLIYILELIGSRSDKVNKIFKGEPSVLIYDGQIILDEMNKNKMELEQLRGLLRASSVNSIHNAKHVILETGGQTSVTTYDENDKTLTLMLVDVGEIEKEVMSNHSLTESWLKEELAKLGHYHIEDLLYVEWSKDNDFYVIRKDEVREGKVRIDG